MSIVKEVADGLGILADGIENTRKIYNSIRDGKKYLENTHPDVRDDISFMCIEMRKTLQAISTASSIITHFEFNVTEGAIAGEPTRFNEHLMRYKTQAMDVENQLDSLRGHCHKIRDHANSLEEKASKLNLSSMLKLFGFDSEAKEKELSDALDNVYNDEMQFHSNVWNMRMILEKSLEDIGSKLGPQGSMDATNIPEASDLLGEYARHFRKLETEASYSALQLQGLIDELSK